MPRRASTQSSKRSESDSGGLQSAGTLAALLIVTLLAYQPAWHGAPVWDDDGHVTKVELQSTDGLRRIWTDVTATQQYYPIVHSAFWLMHRAWGDATTGYHIVNICLHVLSAFLLSVLMRRLSIPGGWLAAFVFALHPVNVESVAWMTELKNTLSAPLYLGAALGYLKFDDARPSRGRACNWAIALALFVLALLSKTVTATLPISLLVLAWWRRGEVRWVRDVRPLIPFFALAIAASALTAWVEHAVIGAQGSDFSLTPIERVLLAGRAVWFYAASVVWPANLVFIYPRWTIDQSVWWQYLFPVALAAVVFGLWRLRHRTRGPLAALLLYGAALAPALGFVDVFPFRYSYVADHFQYLAMIPAIASINGAGRNFLLKLRPAPFLLLIPLAWLTWHHSHQYVNAETLYRTTIARNPGAWMAHHNLGLLRLHGAESDLPGALALTEESLRIKPDNSEALNTRGFIRHRMGDPAAAHRDYEASIRIDPRVAAPHNNLGALLYSQGRIDEAMAQYREAIRLNPKEVEGRRNLGLALEKLRRWPEAEAEFREVVRLDPNSGRARDNLGYVLLLQQKLPEALEQLTEAIRLRPDSGPSYASFAAALQELGRFNESIAAYRRAVTLAGMAQSPDFHNSFGTALAEGGRMGEAIDHFREALRLDPQHADAQRNLARATGK